MIIDRIRRALPRGSRRSAASQTRAEELVHIPLADWDRIVGELQTANEALRTAEAAGQNVNDRFAATLNRAADEVIAVADGNGSDVTEAINLLINLTDGYFAHPEWDQDQIIANAYEDEPDVVRSWV